MNQPQQPSEHISETTSEYRTRSSVAIPEDLVAQIPYRLPQACRVVDVIAPEGFTITRVAFGKRTVELEAGVRVRDKLLAEPYETTAPSFVVVTVKNETTDARVAEIAIIVAGEHGPIGGASPFTASARSSSAYAVDEDGGPMPYRPSPSRPNEPSAPMPKERLPSGFVESVRRAPVPPPVPSPSATKRAKEKQATYERWRDRNRPAKTKRRVTGTSNAGVTTSAAARSSAQRQPPVITVYAESVTTHDVPQTPQAPSPSESAMTSVSFYPAHAIALFSALERGVPVPRDCRSTIVLAFEKAADEALDLAGKNQVTVLLSRDLARDFGAAVRIYEEHRSGSSGEEILHLLAKALGRTSASAKPPVEAQTTADAASANDESESDPSPSPPSPTHESPRHTALATVLPLNPRHASDDSRSEFTDGEDPHVP